MLKYIESTLVAKVLALCFLLALIPFFLGSVACDQEKTPSDVPPEDTAEPEIPCTVNSEMFSNVTAEPTAVATVIRVTWESTEENPGWVRFEDSLGRTQNTPTGEASTQHEVLLLGNRPLSTVRFQLMTRDDTLWCSEFLTAETGALPAALPEISQHPDSVNDGGYTIVSILTPNTQFPVILDGEGVPIWAIDPSELGISNGGSPMFRASLSIDRQSILFNFYSVMLNPGAIYRVSLDGESVESVTLPNTKIDFVELPDGGYATIGNSWYSFENGEKFRGDVLLEISPDGVITELWNVFDSIPHGLGTGVRLGVEAETTDFFEDWSHGNAIHYDEQSDDYFLSLQNINSIVRVDRGSGQQIWQLSDMEGDFTLSGNGPNITEFPHSMHFLGDSILVFNRSKIGQNDCSYVVEAELDENTMVATSSWSYISDPCLLVTFLGDVQRLSNGNTLVIWSSSGQMDEVNPMGDSIWRINVELGAAFGFGERKDSLY